MLNKIYKDRKVLITGHTGFKGSWLSLWLTELGAKVCGYALAPNTTPDLFSTLKLNSRMESILGDIRNSEQLEKAINNFKPEIVFHLAAQPLVRESYNTPIKTYETNVIGTLKTLEAARKCDCTKVFINVTTDKCYENFEQSYAYREDDKLGGYDMYSSSKACSEILTASYRNSFLNSEQNTSNNEFLLASARAGNVIGGGDWAADRLIPDCIRAITTGNTIAIRQPTAIRPWQHVLDPLSGYLHLGGLLLQGRAEFSEAFNFGPELDTAATVKEISELVIKNWGSGRINIHRPDTLHEAKLLQLNIDKSKKMLNWHPKYTVKEAVTQTTRWYKAFYSGCDMQDYTIKQIKEFSS